MMSKKIVNKIAMAALSAAILFMVNANIFGQEISITGTVSTNSDNQTLEGANVSLLQPWGEIYKATATDEKGRFILGKLENGGYQLKISYIGFKELLQEITLVDGSADLGELLLEESEVELNEIEIKAKIPMAIVNGDTVAYNSDAFKTLPDASAEDLISKMPGIIITNGKVQAQGEEVKSVLVDGKPFFGSDPNAALKNLPAEIISKIQVFDQQSDQAAFSGVDDGNTTKTINIITRPEMRNGQFGKLYAGYGTDGRYQVGGNTNFFNGTQRISIIGQLNNINQQNFSSEDLLNVLSSSGQRSGRGGRGGGGRGSIGGGGGGGDANDFLINAQGGITTTNAIGLNYSDSWGENLSINGSYFYNQTNQFSKNISSVQYFTQGASGELYSETDLSESNNINHRFNLRADYKINENSSIIWRPSFSIQKNNGNSLIDGITALNSETINASDIDYFSKLSGTQINNNLLFRQRFEKQGRTFSIGIQNKYDDQNGLSELLSVNDILTAQMIIDSINQRGELTSNGWVHSANLNYTEPLGESTSLQFSYRYQMQNDDSEKLTSDFNSETSAYDIINTPLSSVFESNTNAHQFGTGFSYRKGRDFMIIARANVELTKQKSDELYPSTLNVERNYFRFVPFAMARLGINETSNLRFMYRSNTQTPSISQLQNVVDNSNPLLLTTGNPNLDQSISHNLSVRFQNTNLDRATVFYTYFNASFTSDYVGSQTFTASSMDPIFQELDIDRGVQLSRPINMSGYQNYRTFLTYGMPLTFIKTNLNFDLSGSHSKVPGFINSVQNFSFNNNVTTGVTLSSNISEKVDFSVGSRIGFNTVKNSVQSQLNEDYWTITNQMKVGWILPGGIVFRSSIVHQSYSGLSQGFDDAYFLWNAGIGKKLFKNQLGEISLSAFDILNQNQSITRNVGETYIEDLRTNVLQQYLMLTFTYNFRNWNVNKEEN